MKITLTLKNYRCFVSPATVDLARGFTAFVGVNNAGKSAFMRFLLEFRPLFQMITEQNHFLHSLGTPQSTRPLIHVLDPSEVFSNLNDEPIQFWFEFLREEGDPLSDSKLKVRITFSRDFRWMSDVIVDEQLIQFVSPGIAIGAGNILLRQNVQKANDFVEEVGQ